VSKWPTKPLGEVCEVRPPKSEARHRLAGDAAVSFLPMEDLRVGEKYVSAAKTRSLTAVEKGYVYFADGDVLLPKISPCFENGKLGIARGLVNGVGFGSSEYIVLRPTEDISAEWLYYFLSRAELRDEGSRLTYGTVGQRRLPKEFVEGYPIPVAPLSEQQRIVAILDEAFAEIAAATANAEENLLNADALYDSYLDSLFLRRGPEWAESQQTLEELCDLIVDCEHKTAPTQAEGIPSIRTPNVGRGKLILKGVNRVSDATYADWTRRAVPAAGDLILAREAPAGNVAVIPEDTPLCLGQRTVLLRPNRNVFEPAFLALLLLQPEAQSKLLAHSRGATVQHVNLKDIRAFAVGAIPPLATQRRIVTEAADAEGEVSRLSGASSRKLALLDELKRSLLREAFSGNL